ncbi:hypothetical protein AAHE18_06G058700 [Arachis hypogaea]
MTVTTASNRSRSSPLLDESQTSAYDDSRSLFLPLIGVHHYRYSLMDHRPPLTMMVGRCSSHRRKPLGGASPLLLFFSTDLTSYLLSELAELSFPIVDPKRPMSPLLH